VTGYIGGGLLSLGTYIGGGYIFKKSIEEEMERPMNE
jgi:hypothetical protein